MSKTDDSDAEEKREPAEESAEAEAKPAAEPASRDDEDEDEDEDEEQEKAPPKREPARRSAAARGQSRAAPAAAGSSVPTSRVALFVIVALAAGGTAGWFGQQEQSKARLRAESAAAAPAGSGAPTGPCGAWQGKVCDSAGEASAICAQAKGATDLLTPSTCESALEVMPATLTKIKAARKSCDSLVGKLCKDLPPGASSCEMVKEKTPAFPSKRCDEMLEHYDEVLASLRELEQQGGIPMAGPGGPGAPGGPVMRPPGAVPGH